MLAALKPSAQGPPKIVPQAATVGVIVIAGLALLGWAADIPALRSGYHAAMNPMTAVALLLAALSFWLQRIPHDKASPSLQRRFAQISAAAIALLGLLKLGDYVFGWNVGLDLLLYRHLLEAPSGYPGRMAANSALCLALVGLALLFLDVETRPGRRPGEWLTLGAALISGMAVIGHAYEMQALFDVTDQIPMTLNTAIAFLLLSTAILTSRADRGLLRIFLADSPGGILARRLFPTAVLIPVIVGWLRLEGERTRLYDSAFGVALFATVNVVVFAALLYWMAASLDRLDARRRQEEKKRHAIEERFRALAETANDGIVAADARGRISYFNKSAERIFGYAAAEILGQPLTALMPERFYDAHRRGFERFLSTGEAHVLGKTVEMAGKRKDGSEFPVDLSLATWKAGGEIFFTAMIRDISERKRSEQTQARLAAMLEAAPDFIGFADARDTHVLYVNRAGRKMTGLGEEEDVTKLKIADVHPAWANQMLRDEILPAATRDGFWTGECAFLHRDGHEIAVLMALHAHKNSNGEVEAFSTISRDITGRKRTEQALRESEERFRLLLTGVKDYAIFMLDPEGRVASWNEGAERIKGYRAQEILGRHFSCFYAPEDMADGKPEREIQRAIAEGRVEDEGWRVRKDGSRFWASVVMTAVRDAAETLRGFAKVTRDISEQKRAQAELERQAAELARSNAELAAINKELDAFTYSVSHDLRAPLRQIDGFSRILQEELPGVPPQAQHCLDRIQEGVVRMGRLVDDLLNLGRVGRKALSLERTPLQFVVQEAIAELELESNKRAVDWRIDELPVVEGDPGLLKLVYVNLLSNALKFTQHQPRTTIHIGQQNTNGETIFFVRDNGIGFNMRYAHKLFGIFQRLHRQEDFQGTGVGLANVQRIIHKHGGRVWAEAQPYKGATFYFTLGSPERSEAAANSTLGGEAWQPKPSNR